VSPVLSREQLDRIIEFSQGRHRLQDFDHTFWHIELTVRIAEFLAEREGADKEVCAVAAYLHDIAKNNSERHSSDGAEEASNFLASLEVPGSFIKQVHYAISQHDNDRPKETLEAKVLWDADKLQSIGPLGFARVFGYRLFFEKQDIRYAVERAREYIDFFAERFYTDTGRSIARRMFAHMEEFFKLYQSAISVDFAELARDI